MFDDLALMFSWDYLSFGASKQLLNSHAFFTTGTVICDTVICDTHIGSFERHLASNITAGYQMQNTICSIFIILCIRKPPLFPCFLEDILKNLYLGVVKKII